MKKLILGFLVLAVAVGSAMADGAVARFQAVYGQRIQVVVDGKLMNKLPKSAVRISGKPGTHTVTIKVFNRYGRVRWVHKDKIVVKAGYIVNYTISYDNRYGTRLQKMHTDPLHVDRYRRPEKFYNKRNLAVREDREGRSTCQSDFIHPVIFAIPAPGDISFA